MSQNTHSSPAPPASAGLNESLLKSLTSPEALALLGCVAVLGGMSLFNGRGKKGVLADGRFAGAKELTNAKRVALDQIENRIHDEVAVYLGRPGDKGRYAPTFLPDAQRGTLVVGGPGSGKTASYIDQATYSVIDQGFPLLVWDFKYPSQAKTLAGYAAKKGYNINVFAPGYPESGVCNILDFLKGEPDDYSLWAAQLAETLNRNFKRADTKGNDPYFETAGNLLIQSVLALARSTPYPDLITCQAILSTENLTKRLKENREKIDPWIYVTFSQFISSSGSEKTAASIVSTAHNLFTTFMKGKLLSCLVGKTTIPIELTGKQMLIVGLDKGKRDVLAPLCATIIDMIVSQNVIEMRNEPLFLILDEFPTLTLPRITNWLNECRSYGLCTILGLQELAQAKRIYGAEMVEEIITGCMAKAIFNPQNATSAEYFSKFFGEEEVRYQTKSRNQGKGGSGSSINENVQHRPLVAPSYLLKMPKGKGVIVNASFASLKGSLEEGYLPLRIRVPLSPNYLKLLARSKQLWKKIQKILIERVGNSQVKITQKDLLIRTEFIEEFLAPPDPASEEDKISQSGSKKMQKNKSNEVTIDPKLWEKLHDH